MSGAGGAFLRLSQSALARMLRIALLFGDEGDVPSPAEDDSELDEDEATGMRDLAGVVAPASWLSRAGKDSGVSSGEKWLVGGGRSRSREESKALPLESCGSDEDIERSNREM